MNVKKIFLYLFLFTLIVSTIFSSSVYASEAEYVYLGGKPIGIVMEGDGLEICGKTEVITDSGAKMPAINLELLPGDRLVSINGQKVNNIQELSDKLSRVKDSASVTLGVNRKNRVIEFSIVPQKESLTNIKKLGLIIRDGTAGIGTVTYVKKDGRFGALGHSISENDNINCGKAFNCKILGVNFPKNNVAGELKGVFDKNSTVIGKIDKNNQYGIFGKIEKPYGYTPEVRLGNKNLVQEGKAYIYSCVGGVIPQKYEIEIVKAYNQDKSSVKSMVIKVTDEKLLAKSGGIVQGMSGSPIVQNGYLVGAVTHVFTGDATKGYGLYIDWMINN